MQQLPQHLFAHAIPAPYTVIVEQQQQEHQQCDADRFTEPAKKRMRELSYIQLVMSILCVMAGVNLLAVFLYNNPNIIKSIGYKIVAFAGYGIWIGAYWLVVATIGLVSTCGETNFCKIVAAMVLNIICASSSCVVMVSYSTFRINDAASESKHCQYKCQGDTVTNTELVLDSIILFTALIQLLTAIWCAVLCCRAVCSCCKGKRVQKSRKQMYERAVDPAGVQFNPTGMQFQSKCKVAEYWSRMKVNNDAAENN